MTEIYKNLFIGNEQECSILISKDWAIIHACKNPCHANAVGYRGSLPSSHPNYLILEKNQHLFLNMVDMERELSPAFTNPIMQSAMRFIEKNISERKVFIHCNQGFSRSPSIALLYLAANNSISNDSYSDAVTDFRELYPPFNPGRGIAMYMNTNWADIIKL